MTNSISDLGKAEVILLTGSNPTVNHPVIGEVIKRSVLSGRTKLIVIDPRELPIARYATLQLRPRPGTDVAWINGMARVILEEGLYDQDFVRERTEGFEELRRALEDYTPERVEKITGIPAGELMQAARLYAGAEQAAILYAMGITQHVTGTDNVIGLANLALLTGNLGKEGAGINPLRGQNNVQGACDMGGLPNVLPGYQSVQDPRAREKFARVWGVENLPEKPGLTVMEMMEAAAQGKVKALYIMGENPMVSDPDIRHLQEALDKVELLVVQDIFLTETARRAHVVLPAASFAEKEGTFTNTDRRVQRVRKAVEPPGDAREDSWIVAEVSRRLGYDMGDVSASAVMEEIASLTPQYGGISYQRLEELGYLHWPCPTPDHPGTPILHVEKFTRGKGLFSAVEFKPPAELPDEEYPFYLTTGRILFHYHTGTMTRRSAGIEALASTNEVWMNPEDARELGVEEGEHVVVQSRRGAIRIRAKLTEDMPQKVLFIPFHFGESPANALTNPALDPVAKIPEYKVAAVRVLVGKEAEGVDVVSLSSTG